MTQSGLAGSHRTETGEISHKHGNTRIGTLRKTYGRGFTFGCSDDHTLADVLKRLDEPSLTQLLKDHEAGRLEKVLCGRLA